MTNSALGRRDAGVGGSELLAQMSRGFSCPQEPFGETFFEFLAIERARQVARDFLRLYEGPLSLSGRGLPEFLQRWLRGDTDFQAVWDFSLGEIDTAAKQESPPNVAATAAFLALRLGACGATGDWSLAFDVPVRLRWSHWLLPPCDKLEVHCDGQFSQIQATLRGERVQCQFHRTADGWEGSGSGLQELSRFGTRRERIVLLPSEALEGDALRPLRPSALPEIPPEIIAACQQSLVLLHKHAPVYLPWVLRVLRHIVLLKHEVGNMRSGCSRDESGLIHMSFVPHWMYLAESLVHEASHQYLHALCWLGPLDDGSDATLYYSPIKQTGRSLLRIALAYHAFANILLFFRLCRRNGAPDDGYLAKNESMVAAQVKQLEAPLHKNPALTPIGLALCEPLMERLREDF
jgi:HEXXH motif-containing protein